MTDRDAFRPQPGRFLLHRISDTFRTAEDIAAWLRARGLSPINPETTDNFARVGTIEGITVYRNGWVAGAYRDGEG